MTKYPDFWKTLLGPLPPGFFLGYMAIAVFAAFGTILYMATQKYKNLDGTPAQWSWRYFIVNNSGNFIASLVVLPVFVRGLIEIKGLQNFMVLVSIGLGLGFYKLAKLANNIGIWTTDKVSEKIAEKIKSAEISPPKP